MLTVPELVVSFEVPYLTPPTANHYTRPCKYIGKDGQLHTGKKLTKEAKAFYDAVAIFARGRSVTPATAAELRHVKYSVELDVYLGKGQRLDADNAGKCGVDSLVRAGVLHSDAFVVKCIVNLHKEARENPHTEFIVTRLED